jgi:polysaccharide pyruvyl transferase WcaK-like protein
MKKCMLISYFYSDNLGDICISNKIESEVKKYFEITKYHINGNINIEKRKKNAHKKNKIITIMRKIKLGFLYDFYSKIKIKSRVNYELSKMSFDCAIFGGGNLLFETTYNSKYIKNIENICNFLRKHNIPYIFSSIGAGPFFNKAQKARAIRLVSNSFYSSFRDEASYRLLYDDSNKEKMYITSDPVLSCNITTNRVKKTNYILINIINIDLFFNNYDKEKMVKKLIDIIKQISVSRCKKICIFSSDKADYPLLNVIYMCLNKDGIDVELEFIETVQDLFDLISGADFIIASRMHSLIISYLLNKEFLSLSWSEKVNSFMNIIEMNERNIKYEDVSFDDIDSLMDKKIVYNKKQIEKLRKLYKEEVERIESFERNI